MKFFGVSLQESEMAIVTLQKAYLNFSTTHVPDQDLN